MVGASVGHLRKISFLHLVHHHPSQIPPPVFCVLCCLPPPLEYIQITERCCNASLDKCSLPETTIGQCPHSLHCFPKPFCLLFPNSLSSLCLLSLRTYSCITIEVVFSWHIRHCTRHQLLSQEISPVGEGQGSPMPRY